MAKRIVPSHQTCTKCGETFPYTTDYFYKRSGRDDLRSDCKSCHAAKATPKFLQWQKDNPDKVRVIGKRYRSNPENRQKVKERYARRYASRRNSPEYRQKVNARQKEKYRADPEYRRKVLNQSREWYQGNAEKVKESSRAWHKNNPEVGRAIKLRRRARQASLPDDFTAQDWQYALGYFGGCCAVCGNAPGFWLTIAADHWIPLASSECLGTVPENIVPLCHAKADGQGGCNNEKHARDPEEWLTAKLGKVKAKTKLAEICAYFETVRKRR